MQTTYVDPNELVYVRVRIIETAHSEHLDNSMCLIPTSIVLMLRVTAAEESQTAANEKG
jgi:hypothetical protein